jgi:nucleotide-binding universal stress UspA family protein
MFKRIMLCYDGTREGRNALRLGAAFAASQHVETHVLVVSTVAATAASFGAMTEASVDADRIACQAVLDESLAWLRARGVEAHPHIAAGKPIDAIPRMASALHIDLVIVGHTARTPWGRWWAGAENTALCDRLPCSVLIAMNEQRPTPG